MTWLLFEASARDEQQMDTFVTDELSGSSIVPGKVNPVLVEVKAAGGVEAADFPPSDVAQKMGLLKDPTSPIRNSLVRRQEVRPMSESSNIEAMEVGAAGDTEKVVDTHHPQEGRNEDEGEGNAALDADGRQIASVLHEVSDTQTGLKEPDSRTSHDEREDSKEEDEGEGDEVSETRSKQVAPQLHGASEVQKISKVANINSQEEQDYRNGKDKREEHAVRDEHSKQIAPQLHEVSETPQESEEVGDSSSMEEQEEGEGELHGASTAQQ